MTKRELGEVIAYLRKKRKVEAKALCRGICSETTLLRLEQGERVPDYMILEMILERLGKSIHKIEIIFNQNEYNVFCIQESINAALDEKEYGEVKQLLMLYENCEQIKLPLYRQFQLKVKAILSIEEKKKEEAIHFLEEAIEITLPGFQMKDMKDYLLGETELILILMWVEQVYQVNRNETFLYSKEEVLSYIEELYTDEELLVDIYPKAARIFIIMQERAKDYEGAVRLCEKTINLLTSNGMILYLLQFLLLYRRNLFFLGKVEEAKKVLMQEKSLTWLYQKYEYSDLKEEINIWKKYDQKEIYLMSEMIRQERKRMKKSQEKIADILEIDQKTISRIETGRYAPKPGTFQRLKTHLQINRDIYSTLLVVKDFELLELRRDIARAMCRRNYKQARILFEKLKNSITRDNKENMQYIGYMEVLLEYKQNNLEQTKVIDQCLQVLSITRSGNQLDHLDEIVLGRHEILIVNLIARMYYEIGQKEKAISILENALISYEKSKVNLANHYVGVSMIYGNLMNYYEETGKLEKAKEFCEKAIRLQLICHRGNLIGEALMQKAYIIELENGDRKTCQFYYKQAFQFYILMKDIYSKTILDKHYLEIFKEKID